MPYTWPLGTYCCLITLVPQHLLVAQWVVEESLLER